LVKAFFRNGTLPVLVIASRKAPKQSNAEHANKAVLTLDCFAPKGARNDYPNDSTASLWRLTPLCFP
jgi:hypothetical protein